MNSQKPVVLISCVKTKRDHRCAAKDLYDSTLFSAQRNYAEAVARRWFILSAKYGLVAPDTEIAPYEKTLNGAGVAERRAWSERVAAALKDRIAPSTKVIITAGENYCRFLVPVIESWGIAVERPLKGLSMGFQPGRLWQLTANAKENRT
jgi:hypothetical protein